MLRECEKTKNSDQEKEVKLWDFDVELVEQDIYVGLFATWLVRKLINGGAEDYKHKPIKTERFVASGQGCYKCFSKNVTI